MKTTPAMVVALGLSLALAGTALAAAKEPKSIQVHEKIKIKATVEAIDQANRTVTLKGPKGNLMTLAVDESVQRFSALKVGDQVNATYYESVVVEVRKPGQAPDDSLAIAGGTLAGSKPGGAAVVQTTTTVTVEAIDMATPAVTVKTADGNSVSFRVHKKKYLEGVKVGDQVVIVETDALMIDVQAGKG